MHHGAAKPAGQRFSGQRQRGHAHPGGMGAGGTAAKWKGVQAKIYFVVQRQVVGQVGPGMKIKPFNVDAFLYKIVQQGFLAVARNAGEQHPGLG